MNQNPEASDWSADRGKKWRRHLTGMEAMLAPVNQPLLQELHLDTPVRVADIGCGGGGMTLDIWRRAPAGSVVHGFDISPVLIEVARTRQPSDDRAIAFEIADMGKATAPETPYDRLVSRFGVMFFEDPVAAFDNLKRWLAPGGRFAFAVWGRHAENPWMMTARDVVAKIIDLPQPDPDAPGPFRYADADKLVAVLDRAGFGGLGVHDWRGSVPIGGGLPALEAANFLLSSVSSFAELLAEAGDDAFQRAGEPLAALYSRHEQDGIVHMDASVHIFTGARPR
jgi:SAM-dependent methyltransferase